MKKLLLVAAITSAIPMSAMEPDPNAGIVYNGGKKQRLNSNRFSDNVTEVPQSTAVQQSER